MYEYFHAIFAAWLNTSKISLYIVRLKHMPWSEVGGIRNSHVNVYLL